mmetsp:Transcript_14150/g.36309  ORF Transcript_14150/g.36309 Transcript_14150/m.36309 type:complete len:142 (+) Transcript_14150:201-626(+)
MAASFGQLAAEALSSGQELDAAIDEALACPCVAELREGPCGEAFAAAFRCFVRHQAADDSDEQRGGSGGARGETQPNPSSASDSKPAPSPSPCGAPYGVLQECIQKHPAAFAEFMKAPSDGAEQAGSAEAPSSSKPIHAES